MARLYANENFPRPVVVELRKLGHDVLTVQEAGNANRKIPDEAVLLFATKQARAVITINRQHFIRLHKQTAEHAGIVVCTKDLNFAAQAERVHKAITAEDTLAGRLVRVYLPG